jgi:hypothetical protein
MKSERTMTQPLAKTSKCAASTRKNSRLLPFLRNRTDFFSGLLGSSTYGTQFTNQLTTRLPINIPLEEMLDVTPRI